MKNFKYISSLLKKHDSNHLNVENDKGNMKIKRKHRYDSYEEDEIAGKSFIKLKLVHVPKCSCR